MKRIAIAIALGSALAAAAPGAFAQSTYERYPGERWSEREPARETLRERDYRSEYRADERWRDSARVIATRPVYEREARQECWNPRAGHYEEVRGEEGTRVGKGAAIGAVAGGVLGHQVDSGTGTAAGAVIGGLLGHQVEKRRDSGAGEQDDLDYTRCREVAGGDRGDIAGYEVRYEHDGREYVTRMDHEPGERLRLGRDVNRDGTPFERVARSER